MASSNKNQYWINAGEVKTTKSSLGTFTSLDDIVCDILKCKFGMDCCTGEDETPANCCVQFDTGDREPDCDKFTGTYWINTLGEVYQCVEGTPTLLYTMLTHTEGDNVSFGVDRDALSIFRQDNAQTTEFSMTTPLVDPVITLSHVADADLDDTTYIKIESNGVFTVSGADISAVYNYATIQNSEAKIGHRDTAVSANSTSIAFTAGNIKVEGLVKYADDTAAALGGVIVGGLYQTAGAVKIRLV